MFFTPNEVRNSSQTHEAFLVYWNLNSVKCSGSIVTALASICIVFSCIALKVCFSWLLTQMAPNTHQWCLPPLFTVCKKSYMVASIRAFKLGDVLLLFLLLKIDFFPRMYSDYGFPSPTPPSTSYLPHLDLHPFCCFVENKQAPKE